jgi:hypothetical protein
MTAGVVDTTLRELLSPSQVNTFLLCSAKWYFRYALGLAEPPTGTLALGTAFHSVLAANFRQKIKPNRTFPPGNSRSRLAKRSQWRPSRGCRIPRRRGTGGADRNRPRAGCEVHG